MILQVGKCYRRRDGGKEEIVEYRQRNPNFPFISKSGRCYPEHGLYSATGLSGERDLVSEWEDDTPIKTVTKQVVVPGVYGNLSVNSEGGVHVAWTYGPDNIRGMATLLNKIADVMEESK